MNQYDEQEIDLDEMMFLSIIYSFHASTMQSLGKVVNPMTGKIDRSLDAARGSIDALLMLQKKTKGNLSEREDKILRQIIQELQLNYLDESKTEPAQPEPAAEKPPETRENGAEPGENDGVNGE